MNHAYIIDAVRTPRGIGKPGVGALSHLHPQHLGATVLKALATRNTVETKQIDDVIFSTSVQRGKQGSDIGRMSALLADYAPEVSGMTLDRFCGGGITAVNLAAGQIMSGLADCVVAGGVEMMSYHAQLLIDDAAVGVKPLGMGAGNGALQKIHPQAHQGVCADAIAAMEGISREVVDALALESQQRADVAIREGRFSKSLVTVYNEDGSVALDRDEFPRPQTTIEGLGNLKPSFGALADYAMQDGFPTYRQTINQKFPDLRWGGIHHAGNSSGVVDGASAILLASSESTKRNGWKARGRVVMAANIGDCPLLMLNAPVPAALRVLQKAGLTVEDIDLWEINEAFAVVAEKFMRDLRLDRKKVNVNGGACALGHPIGATGAMLIGTVLDELERRDLKRGLVTMCAAGGMAPAIIIERV
ncbi:acetyl-CoA C-acetyltransferase [soil metagenome]